MSSENYAYVIDFANTKYRSNYNFTKRLRKPLFYRPSAQSRHFKNIRNRRIEVSTTGPTSQQAGGLRTLKSFQKRKFGPSLEKRGQPAPMRIYSISIPRTTMVELDYCTWKFADSNSRFLGPNLTVRMRISPTDPHGLDFCSKLLSLNHLKAWDSLDDGEYREPRQ